MHLHPYLAFNGNAREAFEFYAEVLNGKITMSSTFKESPMEIPDSHKDQIMHIHMTFDECELMASDTMAGSPKAEGNNVALSLAESDPERAEQIFNQLADGGKILQPLSEVFWGGKFGMCEDKFGIRWMMSSH